MKSWRLRERPHGYVVVNGSGESVSPGFRAREDALAWVELRAQVRPPKRRPCMACGRSFESAGAHHRLCPHCARAHVRVTQVGQR